MLRVTRQNLLGTRRKRAGTGAGEFQMTALGGGRRRGWDG